mgnify:CR=1 FL=1
MTVNDQTGKAPMSETIKQINYPVDNCLRSHPGRIISPIKQVIESAKDTPITLSSHFDSRIDRIT